MKLYVDDIRNAPDDTWKVSRTITDAINAIEIFDFEEISIDHDISHQITMAGSSRPYPCEETFLPVAVFLKAKYKGRKKRPKITIHTSNPAGALRIQGFLDGFKVTVKESIPANRLETVL